MSQLNTSAPEDGSNKPDNQPKPTVRVVLISSLLALILTHHVTTPVGVMLMFVAADMSTDAIKGFLDMFK